MQIEDRVLIGEPHHLFEAFRWEPYPSHTLVDVQIYQLMASTHRVLLAHPDLVPLYLARQGARGPNAQRLGDLMLTLLGRADVTGEAAREALRVLIVYTIGFAAFATRPPVERDADRPPTTEELFNNFTAGLRWLLAGIINISSEASRKELQRRQPSG